MKRALVVILTGWLLVAGAATAPASFEPSSAPGRAAAGDLALVSSLDSREELLAVAIAGDAGAKAEKSPGAMGMLSLVVPGAGQVVQGQKRGYLYLLAELALWGGFYVLDQKGLEGRDDYESFADENWDHAAYVVWYQENCVDCDDCAGEYDCRPVADYGTQEYYEDIGKYATYWRWWNIDGDEGDIVWDEYSSGDAGTRDDYWDLRIESNRHLRQARYFMMAVLLNHVVSAFDSFMTARGVGDPSHSSNEGLGVEFDVAEGGDGLTVSFVARY